MHTTTTAARSSLENVQRQVLGQGVDWRHIIAIGGICVTGFVLRFLFLTHESLDGDEFASLYFAHFPFSRLWTEALDTHPPLYYSIQRTMLAFGGSEALLRAPSAILGTLAVLATYLLARRAVSRHAALLAAALMATSAGQIADSQWARPYALLTAAALGTALAVVGIFSNYSRAALSTSGERVLYVLSITIALYSHNIACLLFVVTAIFGLAQTVAVRSLKCFVEWIALNSMVLLFWWWWLIVVVQQAWAGLTNLSWAPPLTLNFVQDNLASAYGPQFIWHFRSIIHISTLVVVGIVIVSAGIIINHVKSGRIPLAYLLTLVVCIPAAEIAISLMWRPVFMQRTIVWIIPFYYILAALVITFFRSRWILGVVLSSIGAIFILDLYAHYRKPYNADYRALIDDVYTASRDGDVIVTVHPFEYTGVNYYLSKHSARALTVIDRPTEVDRLVAHLPAAPVAHLPPATDRVWLIFAKGEELTAESVTGAELASYRLVRRYDEKNVAAELYQTTRGRL